MSASKLESAVITQVKSYFSSPAMKRLILEETSKPLQIKRSQNPVDRLNAQLEKLPQMRKKQQEAFEKGLITLDEYGEAMGRLREQENKFRVDIAKYSDNQQVSDINKVDRQKIWEAVKDFDSFWESLDFLGRKQFLKSVLERVEAGNNMIEVYYPE